MEGASAYAVAINEAGDVLGSAATASGAYHVFLWHDGVMRDLTPEAPESWATGLNDAGDAVGILYEEAGGDAGRVVKWAADGSPQFVTPLRWPLAASIDGKGRVTGAFRGIDRWFGAYIWNGRVLLSLAGLARTGRSADRRFGIQAPTGVNEQGDIVGWGTSLARGADGQVRGFLMRRLDRK